MKKYFILAAIAFAALSCQKEQASVLSEESATILTVTANIAGYEGTKTSIDGTSSPKLPVWSTGDRIKLYGNNSETAIYELASGAGTSTGTFTPVGQALTGTLICAYYPAERAGVISWDYKVRASTPNYQTFTYGNGSQNQNDGTFANGSYPMIGTGTVPDEHGNTDINFKNIFGLVQINLLADSFADTVRQIALVSSSTLRGSMNVSRNSLSATFNSNNGKNGVSLYAIGDDGILNTTTSKAFYISVPPTSITKIYVETDKGLYEKEVSISVNRSRNTRMAATTLSAAGFTRVTYPGAEGIDPVLVKGTVWAPVNCGFNAQNHPYGLKYQWGRKYGASLPGENPVAISDTITTSLTVHPDTGLASNDTLYVGLNKWYDGNDVGSLWSSSSKAAYDPCPQGWRIASTSDFQHLWVSSDNPDNEDPGQVNGNFSNQQIVYGGNTYQGHYFDGISQDDTAVSGVFLETTNGNTFWTSFYTYYSGVSAFGTISVSPTAAWSNSTGDNAKVYRTRCIKE